MESKSTKYDILITYIRTPDNGLELKHAFRSLDNIINFNGNVTVVGDSEQWFQNIRYIRTRRIHGDPYGDVLAKLRHAAFHMPDKFIISMDDVFVTEPIEVKFPNRGILTSDNKNYYRRTKLNTIELLKEHGVNEPLNYEVHAPYLVEKDKLIQTFDIILKSPNRGKLQWRSIYGNLFNPETEYMEDKKCYDGRLKQGSIISTQFYTSDLDKLFPEACEFEAEYVV